MEQDEKQLSEQESLFIIQQMIQTAKKEQRDDGKGWIIWGWAIFTASIFTVINRKTHWFDSTFIFWNLFGLLTLLLLVFEIIRDFFVKKHKQVKTYTEAIFKKLNVGFFACLTIIILSMNLGVPPMKGFALLLGLYGFWIFIYGALLDFKPSFIGAYATWICAVISLFAETFEWVMILHAIAVLCGYIIPCHIANHKFKHLSGGNITSKESV